MYFVVSGKAIRQ